MVAYICQKNSWMPKKKMERLTPDFHHNHHVAFTEMGHSWSISTSILLSTSLHVSSCFYSAFVYVHFKNTPGSLLRGFLFSWFILFMYIYFFCDIVFNWFNISMFVCNWFNYNLNVFSQVLSLLPITIKGEGEEEKLLNEI